MNKDKMKIITIEKSPIRIDNIYKLRRIECTGESKIKFNEK